MWIVRNTISRSAAHKLSVSSTPDYLVQQSPPSYDALVLSIYATFDNYLATKTSHRQIWRRPHIPIQHIACRLFLTSYCSAYFVLIFASMHSMATQLCSTHDVTAGNDRSWFPERRTIVTNGQLLNAVIIVIYSKYINNKKIKWHISQYKCNLYHIPSPLSGANSIS